MFVSSLPNFLNLNLMKKIILLSFLSAAALLSSCKKENYDDKYQPIGDYGNASIVTSNTVTLNNWTQGFDDGINYEYSAQLTWPVLTQAVVDNAMVMMYLKDGNDWIAMPFSFSDDSYAAENWNFFFSTGTATVSVSGYDDSGSGSASDYNGTVVKMVVVSSEVRALHPDVDFNDFEQVSIAFGIK